MDDRTLLIFLHQRFSNVYHENECVDYLHRLRDIVIATPKGRKAPRETCSGAKELEEILLKKDSIQFEKENQDLSEEFGFL